MVYLLGTTGQRMTEIEHPRDSYTNDPENMISKTVLWKENMVVFHDEYGTKV